MHHAIRRWATAGLLAGWAVAGVRADHYTAQNGQAPQAPYDTWAKAASNIQDAVNVAATGAVVWVGAGRYTLPPNATNFAGWNVLFLTRPVALRGSNGVPGDVVLDGEGLHRVVAVYYEGSTSNQFLFDGLTLANGYATNKGGGMLLEPSASWNAYTAVVQNCVIRDNTVVWGGIPGYFGNSTNSNGGGIASQQGKSLVASNSVFRGNVAENGGATHALGSGGGAVYLRGGGLRLTDCIVETNVAGSAGGISAYITTPLLERCVVRGNTASGTAYGQQGGGVSLAASTTPTLRNCLFHHNVANYFGGAIVASENVVHIEHCTIVSNKGAQSPRASAIKVTRTGAGLRVRNSVIHSNYLNEDFSFDNETLRSNAFATNSCLVTLTNLYGSGNITNAPVFVDFTARDFRMADASPCLNAGTNLPDADRDRDLDGRPRIDRFWGIADMGCFERHPAGALLRLR